MRLILVAAYYYGARALSQRSETLADTSSHRQSSACQYDCVSVVDAGGRRRAAVFYVFCIAGGLAVFLIKPPTTLCVSGDYGLLCGYIYAP